MIWMDVWKRTPFQDVDAFGGRDATDNSDRLQNTGVLVRTYELLLTSSSGSVSETFDRIPLQ